MKKLWDKGWNFLLKHNITVCACLILTCIYFSLIIVNDVNHTKKQLDLLKVNLTLGLELKETVGVLEDQSEFINFQTEVMSAQREALEKQGIAIEGQENILRRLVDYLKFIKHWPPKPLPPIPGTQSGTSTRGIFRSALFHISIRPLTRALPN